MDDLCVPRGPPEGAASLMAASCSSTCSSARGVSSHLGQQEGLSLMVEGVTWWIFATARRCDGWKKRIEVFAFMRTNQLHEAFGSIGSASFKTDGMHSHQYQEKRLLNSSHIQKWQ